MSTSKCIESNEDVCIQYRQEVKRLEIGKSNVKKESNECRKSRGMTARAVHSTFVQVSLV